MTNNIRYYMNNPCVVIREIADEFSEVKMIPRFAKGMSGEYWCDACMLGSLDGAHINHRCYEFQNMIDIINSEQSAIVVLVENRLLHDQPVEFKPCVGLVERNKELEASLEAKRLEYEEFKIRLKIAQKELGDVQAQAETERTNLVGIKSAIETTSSDLERIQCIKCGGSEVNITLKQLYQLFETQYIFESLKSEGLDNWEWWDESMPSEQEIDAHVAGRITNLTNRETHP